MLNILKLPSTCLFRLYTGIPCPFCDLIHSLYYAAHLKILTSLKLNPAGIILILLTLSVFMKSAFKINFYKYLNKKHFIILLLTVVLLSWILKILFFHSVMPINSS
ncbi:hypothetical protein DRQ09_00805 [candidate division KSB1 bacterium]|nr:MAG: hypothetical protein DRQ09_00805 [candidate division KSB1 bacterium]